MKSNIEKVYSKLPKTELSKVELETQKVELGLVDDLKNDSKRMQKGIQELNSLRKQMRKVYFDAIDGANTNRGNFKKAEELGIDKLASEAKEFAGACQASVKKINKKVNLIKQVIKL